MQPEQTDVAAFAELEPVADGFRNCKTTSVNAPAEYMLVDKAQLLNLSAPEMTVLVGGLRALGVSHDGYGVLTEQVGVLSNDFFVNLLDNKTNWKSLDPGGHAFEGSAGDNTGKKWIGTRADLVFGSNSQLRALAEIYAQSDSKEKFVKDFAAAWTKVMELDRYDLHR